jgi:hypothetical protein
MKMTKNMEMFSQNPKKINGTKGTKWDHENNSCHSIIVLFFPSLFVSLNLYVCVYVCVSVPESVSVDVRKAKIEPGCHSASLVTSTVRFATCPLDMIWIPVRDHLDHINALDKDGLALLMIVAGDA